MPTDLMSLYRRLPQVGEYLDSPEGRALRASYPRQLVVDALRAVIARLRGAIDAGAIAADEVEMAVNDLRVQVEREIGERMRCALRPVINATGVILQTNLGRAPLSEAAVAQMASVAAGYCNLEFDLSTGERGRRGGRVEELLLDVLHRDRTSATAQATGALVVNNCAAATFLALNTLAEGGEVLVSRGELVEIGGGFRVPEILRKSGAVLREVGTTNRTRIEDFASAITAQTRLMLRVHRSNFEIVGFTERPELCDLMKLGESAGVPVFEDQGTGCVQPLEPFGLNGESSFMASARSGAALVAASGDKLLGGPQCGILAGQQALIKKLRANPLYRALRVDKLTYAALEATLLAYLSGQAESIPAIQMLGLSAEAIRGRCERWAAELALTSLRAEVVPTQSVVGGGTTPGATLPSYAVALRHDAMSDDKLAARLRALDPPVIGRISQGRVLLDLRTVFGRDDHAVLVLLKGEFALNSDASEGAP